MKVILKPLFTFIYAIEANTPYYHWCSGHHQIEGKNKTTAVVKAINQFLIWYNTQKS